jgi:glycosyltransferase involved in cell wall biosynthesis
MGMTGRPLMEVLREPTIAVITPTVPERICELMDAMDSVSAQTIPVAEHLIGVDYQRNGPAAVRNRLMNATLAEWVAFLDDDDLLDPDHLEILLDHSRDADVVIPYCRFEGTPLPAKFCNQKFNRAKLADHGIFPITVLARRSAILEVGGFWTTDRYEDHALWNRMADRGARFVVVPKQTWTYRRTSAANRTDGTL